MDSVSDFAGMLQFRQRLRFFYDVNHHKARTESDDCSKHMNRYQNVIKRHSKTSKLLLVYMINIHYFNNWRHEFFKSLIINLLHTGLERSEERRVGKEDKTC